MNQRIDHAGAHSADLSMALRDRCAAYWSWLCPGEYGQAPCSIRAWSAFWRSRREERAC